MIHRWYPSDGTRPVIRLHRAALRDHGADEATQAVRGSVWDVSKSNAADPVFAPVLYRHGDDGLPCGSATSLSSFLSPPYVGLIHLNTPRKLIASRPNHGPAQFVQPMPRCFVRSQIQDPLEPQGVRPIRLTRDMPYSAEPQEKRLPGTVKDRAGCDRCLYTAAPAMRQATAGLPSLGSPALRASETIRPAKFEHVFDARRIRSEARLEFLQRPRVILFHASRYYILWSLEPTRYPSS